MVTERRVAMAKGKYQYWLSPEGLTLLAGWARAGLTEEQMAHNAGVSRSTLNAWKASYPDISDTLKKGKEVVDLEVESSLLKRALGYDYYEETEERMFDRQSGEYRMIVTKRVKRTVLPDVTALIFWLKNRMPDRWKDKQNIELSDLREEQTKLDDLISQMRGNDEQ